MERAKQIFPETDQRFLHDSTIIWRYVPLRTLFFYLNGLVFIPSVHKLRASEPFEGECYGDVVPFNGAFDNHFGAARDRVEDWIFTKLCCESERNQIELNPTYPNYAAEIFRQRYFDFIRRTRFAWCWFASQRESAAMWNVYGNQGVAIQSTVGKVRHILHQTDREFLYGSMTYVDYQRDLNHSFSPKDPLLLRPFFLKRNEYDSEKEVRFVTAAPERQAGILLRDLKPQDWVSAIRLWPQITSEEEDALRDAIQKYLPKVDCSKSDLFSGYFDNGPFVKAVHAAFEQSIEKQWKEDSDGIPAIVKKL